ncbi:hypothetical protein H5410_061951 [Solanum commersonii]|uniref:Uncharacterized protein n=1 Tax=Solanum commersonii TaxID=4109 RepID=A0A9J5W9E1_SOLCO|nr:hypothetical protein H5410_061951 [Solanum commersonii]
MKCDNVISYHCLGQKFSYYVKPLYNHGGFGWYNRRKMVVADDRMCAEYIECLDEIILHVHPEITPYSKYGSPIYKKLCHTFMRPIAT